MRRLLSVLAVLAVCTSVYAGVWTGLDLPINRKQRTLAHVDEIVPHPRVAGLVFASTYGEIFRSSDWGFHWKRVEGLAGFNFPFAFNPFDDREIWSFGLWVSRDLGTSFSVFGSAPEIFDPRIPNRAYRLGATHLFDRSDDDGRSWTGVGPTYPLGPPFNLSHFVIAAVAIDSNSTLYLSGAVHGGDCPFYACTTYRSRDAGVTWEAGFTNRYWTLAGSTLFAFDEGYKFGPSIETITIYASVDGGTTWETRGVLNTETTYSEIDSFGGPAVAVDPGGSTILLGLVTSHGGQLYRSDDGGRTWSRIDNGELQDANQDRPSGVESIAIGADGTVYVATGYRMFTNKVDEQRRHSAVH